MRPDPKTRFWRRLAFLWGAAEASLFFIVPDVLIGWVALRGGMRAGWKVARNAGIGALVGGAAMFLWSERAPDPAVAAVQAVPAVSASMVDRARAAIADHGWFRAALSGPATSTPYKVYAVLAPQAGAGLGLWLLAALPIRLPRFLLIATLFGLLRWTLGERFAGRTLAVIYAAAWAGFYGWFFLAHPN